MQFIRNQNGERELFAKALPLSVPARRILSILDSNFGISALARRARLGELERNLLELLRWNLIDIVEPAPGQTFTAALLAGETSLLEAVSPELVANAKQSAIRFLFEHLPLASHSYTFRIEAADSQEALLITFGQAQRELFDLHGRERAVLFYESIVAPNFFPE